VPDQIPDNKSTMHLLTLRLCSGVGAVICARLLERFGSADAALGASAKSIAEINGLGMSGATKLLESVPNAARSAARELASCDRLGVTPIPIAHPAYPPLLRSIPDPPAMLFTRGEAAAASDADPPGAELAVGVVGSRRATAYGIEQAERFAAHLAQHEGMTIVSGGARGIDSAAHRAALRVGGRTIAVLGCGHGTAYPPENADLFRRIAEEGGAVVSELPPSTPPSRENFPPRNRIISGLSLGVLIVEAPARSGALITARLAVEEHGREAVAVPGRIDSAASRGANDLIRSGAAAMALSPADVAEALDAPARHLAAGTHGVRYRPRATPAPPPAALGDAAPDAEPSGPQSLNEAQRLIVEALATPATPDTLVRRTGLNPAQIRAEATVLEMRRLVRWSGSELERR
jgi:DNA processing protein